MLVRQHLLDCLQLLCHVILILIDHQLPINHLLYGLLESSLDNILWGLEQHVRDQGCLEQMLPLAAVCPCGQLYEEEV